MAGRGPRPSGSQGDLSVRRLQRLRRHVRLSRLLSRRRSPQFSVSSRRLQHGARASWHAGRIASGAGGAVSRRNGESRFQDVCESLQHLDAEGTKNLYYVPFHGRALGTGGNGRGVRENVQENQNSILYGIRRLRLYLQAALARSSALVPEREGAAEAQLRRARSSRSTVS